jgi:hypothetical protein
MKVSHLIFTLFISLLTACTTLKSLECVNAQRGNTGNVGIIPADEVDKPRKGKDYFTLELKAAQNCTVEIVHLIVKGYGGQVLLSPVFENNTSKMSLKAHETCYIRVEKENNVTIAKPSIPNMGSLTVKINGKIKVMPIENFREIIPQ